jgi:sarcosine oxidase
MSAAETYDVIVIGGGPVGLSTAWHASRNGQRVLVLERYGFLNQRSSSSGHERHWRVQYPQRDIFALTLQTRPLWRDLETLVGRRLIHEIGSLWFGDTQVDTNEGHIADTARAMDEMSVRYEWLTARDIEKRYAFTRLPRHYEGFLQPDGGIIDVRGTLAALIQLAQEQGAVLRSHETVLEVAPDRDGVTARTDRQVYRADKAVLANGPNANDLIRPWGGGELGISLYEMALVTLRQHNDAVKRPFWFVFQPPTTQDTNLFYGYPPNPWGLGDQLRVGPDFETNPLEHASKAIGTPSPEHVDRVTGWARAHMPWCDPHPVSTSTCLAVLPSDPARQFYLGTAEQLVTGGENVVVAVGGWAYKLVPLFGKICADLAHNGTTPYAVARHALTGQTPAPKTSGDPQ